MLTTGTNGNAAPRRWSPAPYVLPALPYQAVRPAPQLGADTISATERLMRSPTVAFVVDIGAAAASGFLAWGLTSRQNLCVARAAKQGFSIERCPGTSWSTFWWIVTTAMAVKALHDLSEMRA